MAVRVRVPAKVNLALRVGPAVDGYHRLWTLFHAVDLYDEVTVTPASGLSLTITGAEGLPDDERNLAWRAAAALASAARVGADAHIALHKRIPVAGGLAGGSADAAATLVACARLWSLDLDLHPLAAALGADIAFLLHGRNAVGTGRGEVLVPVASGPTLWWVLVPAAFGISAGDAYGEFDRQHPRPAAPTPHRALVAAVERGTVDDVAALLGNDLRDATLALAPGLADTLRAGADAGALAGIVSGSGPTCAFLCRSAEHAAQVAGRLGSPAVVARGPVDGATVV